MWPQCSKEQIKTSSDLRVNLWGADMNFSFKQRRNWGEGCEGHITEQGWASCAHEHHCLGSSSARWSRGVLEGEGGGSQETFNSTLGCSLSLMGNCLHLWGPCLCLYGPDLWGLTLPGNKGQLRTVAYFCALTLRGWDGEVGRVKGGTWARVKETDTKPKSRMPGVHFHPLFPFFFFPLKTWPSVTQTSLKLAI